MTGVLLTTGCAASVDYNRGYYRHGYGFGYRYDRDWGRHDRRDRYYDRHDDHRY